MIKTEKCINIKKTSILKKLLLLVGDILTYYILYFNVLVDTVFIKFKYTLFKMVA